MGSKFEKTGPTQPVEPTTGEPERAPLEPVEPIGDASRRGAIEDAVEPGERGEPGGPSYAPPGFDEGERGGGGDVERGALPSAHPRWSGVRSALRETAREIATTVKSRADVAVTTPPTTASPTGTSAVPWPPPGTARHDPAVEEAMHRELAAARRTEAAIEAGLAHPYLDYPGPVHVTAHATPRAMQHVAIPNGLPHEGALPELGLQTTTPTTTTSPVTASTSAPHLTTPISPRGWAATEEAIDKLNQCLRGELSAVETYELALKSVRHGELTRVLEKLRDSHQHRVEMLRERITACGAEPSKRSGAWGAFARLVQRGADLFGDRAALAALEEGEGHGIKLYTEELEALDEFSLRFLRTQLLPEQERSYELCRELERASKAA